MEPQLAIGIEMMSHTATDPEVVEELVRRTVSNKDDGLDHFRLTAPRLLEIPLYERKPNVWQTFGERTLKNTRDRASFRNHLVGHYKLEQAFETFRLDTANSRKKIVTTKS